MLKAAGKAWVSLKSDFGGGGLLREAGGRLRMQGGVLGGSRGCRCHVSRALAQGQPRAGDEDPPKQNRAKQEVVLSYEFPTFSPRRQPPSPGKASPRPDGKAVSHEDMDPSSLSSGCVS